MNPGVIVPGLVAGPLIVAAGFWIAAHPGRVNRAVYASQRRLLGKRAADLSAGTQSVRATRVLGALFVMFGLWVTGGAAISLVLLLGHQ